MYVVWGIRWDREIDRRRTATAVLALLAALAIGLLAFSPQARAAQPAATAPPTTLDDVRAAVGATQSEAPRAADLLHGLEVELGQGYLFAPPLQPEAFGSLLLARCAA